MSNSKRLLVVLLLAVIVVTPVNTALSQPRPSMRHMKSRADRIEKLRAIRIWKMTEYLNLTEEQSARFFPRLRKNEEKIKEKHREKQILLDEIDRLIKEKDGKLTEQDVRKYIGKLNQINQEIVKLKTSFIIESSDILTPEQQLRCMIFDDRFRNQMMRILSERELKVKEEEENP